MERQKNKEPYRLPKKQNVAHIVPNGPACAPQQKPMPNLATFVVTTDSSSGQTFSISQYLPLTDSISKPQTELTTLSSLASTVCPTLVVFSNYSWLSNRAKCWYERYGLFVHKKNLQHNWQNGDRISRRRHRRTRVDQRSPSIGSPSPVR